jgi:hypothetical protein
MPKRQTSDMADLWLFTCAETAIRIPDSLQQELALFQWL